MAKKTPSGRPARKIAMVQPVSKPVSDLPLFTDAELQVKLLKALQVLKNDRAYVVLEYHNTWAAVHFEGASEPTTIKYK
jgi:hypothetical protein